MLFCSLRPSCSLQFVAVPPTSQRNRALADTRVLDPTVEFLEDGLFCEWAYFIDFEERKLETWKSGSKMIGEVTFDGLKSEGKAYMERMEKIGWGGDEDGEKET